MSMSTNNQSPNKPNPLSQVPLVETPHEAINRVIYEFGGPSELTRLLAAHGLKIDRRTPRIWINQGHIPMRYRRYFIPLIRQYGFLVTDPEGFLRDYFRAPTYAHAGKPKHWPNPELKRWFDDNGGVKTIYQKASEATMGSHEYGYATVFNWVSRGRVPISLREFFIDLGCPVAILDAPLIPDPNRPVEKRTDNHYGQGRPSPGPTQPKNIPNLETRPKQGKRAVDEATTADSEERTDPTPEDLLGE